MKLELELTPELLSALGIEEPEPTAEKVLEALETLQVRLQGATKKLQEIDEAKSLEEVEELLAGYDLPEESAAVMRDIAKGDRGKAQALLGGMRKKGEAEKPKLGSDTLPPPMIHDTARFHSREQREETRNQLIGEYIKTNPGATVEDATKSLMRSRPALFDDGNGEGEERDRLIAEYRKQNPGATFQQAWDYLMKTQPELFGIESKGDGRGAGEALNPIKGRGKL